MVHMVHGRGPPTGRRARWAWVGAAVAVLGLLALLSVHESDASAVETLAVRGTGGGSETDNPDGDRSDGAGAEVAGPQTAADVWEPPARTIEVGHAVDVRPVASVVVPLLAAHAAAPRVVWDTLEAVAMQRVAVELVVVEGRGVSEPVRAMEHALAGTIDWVRVSDHGSAGTRMGALLAAGVEAAHSPVVVVVLPGVHCAPHMIQRMLRVLAAHPESAAVLGAAHDATVLPLRQLLVDALPPVAIAVRRDVLVALGVREDEPGATALSDMVLRVAEAHPAVLVLDDVVSAVRGTQPYVAPADEHAAWVARVVGSGARTEAQDVRMVHTLFPGLMFVHDAAINTAHALNALACMIPESNDAPRADSARAALVARLFSHAAAQLPDDGRARARELFHINAALTLCRAAQWSACGAYLEEHLASPRRDTQVLVEALRASVRGKHLSTDAGTTECDISAHELDWMDKEAMWVFAYEDGVWTTDDGDEDASAHRTLVVFPEHTRGELVEQGVAMDDFAARVNPLGVFSRVYALSLREARETVANHVHFVPTSRELVGKHAHNTRAQMVHALSGHGCALALEVMATNNALALCTVRSVAETRMEGVADVDAILVACGGGGSGGGGDNECVEALLESDDVDPEAVYVWDDTPRSLAILYNLVQAQHPHRFREREHQA